MTTIISANVNGIRSAARKGFFDWLRKQRVDIICLQEIKAQDEALENPDLHIDGYYNYFFSAKRKGYSGVAIYCRNKPNNIYRGLGWPVADEEGRYLQVDFDNLSVASLYMPSGTSGSERQAVKFDFMAHYEKRLQSDLKIGHNFIICGDWNIAHKKIDLKNWSSNQKKSGFLPEERAWLDKLFDQYGLIDAFRAVNKQPEQYTWWSNYGCARKNNVGWRIDYQVVTPSLAKQIAKVDIYTEQIFSDHAPLVVEYSGQLI